MPRPNGPIKQSGDIHLPDVESDLDVEEAATGMAALARPRDWSGRNVVRRAGLLRASDGDTDAGARRYESVESDTPSARSMTRRLHLPLGPIALGFIGLVIVRKLLSR